MSNLHALTNRHSIRMVSKDQEPLDLSNEEALSAFKKSMEKWSQKMSDNKGGYAYGFVDFVGIQPKPYGEAY